MGIRDIEWYPYRIALRSKMVTAHNTLNYREGAIVEIRLQDGLTGVGEIAPLPDFNQASLNETLAALRQSSFIQRVRGKPVLKALHDLYAEVGNLPPSAICGLECALFDALGQAQNRSIGSLLARDGNYLYRQAKISAPRLPILLPRMIPVNVVIGTPTDEAAVLRAQAITASGFRCIKLKVGQGIQEDISRIKSVREAVGPDVALRLDANEGWTFEEACTILQQCANLNIQYVEQPLPASDLIGMHNLRETVSIPIAADEAVYGLESARQILSHEAADILVLKPQLAGGMCMCRQIIREAQKYGVRCVITSAIETGIGVVAAIHLAAASPEVRLECGLATLHLLADDLLQDELHLQKGYVMVPVLPGLGVQLDRDALKKYSYHLEEE